MTEREQLLQLARWNRELARENSRLLERLARVADECGELRRSNAGLLAEREASEALLDAAMDEALRVRP